MTAEKKKHKGLKIFLWVIGIIFALLLILFIIFHRNILAGLRIIGGMNALTAGSEGMTYTERLLTKEQMLSDFDYLYKVAVTDSKVREQYEKYFRLDYNDVYNTFRPRIENCKDEFEFFSVMLSFMARLPGAHNVLYAPTNDLGAELEFPLYWELGYDDVIKANYDYWVQFEDKMWSYTQRSALAACYGPDYVFINSDFGNGQIEEILMGRLISLDGEPISTAIRRLDSVYTWGYDAQNDCVRTNYLFFNDGVGEKYEAEIEMPDGSIVNKTLYCSAEFGVSMYYRSRLYPDHAAKEEPQEPPQEETQTETESSGDTVWKSYTVETDKDRKLVYVRTTTCLSTEVQSVYEDIMAAADEIDAENIIIDMQENGGGDFHFAIQGLCRAIFDGDVGWLSYSDYLKTDITELFYEHMTADPAHPPFDDMGSYLRYGRDLRIKGEAKKKYNIYVLTSLWTFSSGDIFSGVAATQDNVILLGENTKGEGFAGSPLNYYLPESKLGICVSVSTSEDYPDNNLVGTIPDIYCPTDWEDFTLLRELINDPDIVGKITKLEGRMLWDRPLREAIRLIDSRS